MTTATSGIVQENLAEARPLQSGIPTCDVIGSSEPMQAVFASVERVAPTSFTVLITGETGAGKEVVARAIHRISRRASAPFIAVDCGSIPETLIESELFGHEKGAFTGADRARTGKFELASGGTLFLDEVSNLPLDLQPRLLRALQERRIWRVGSTDVIEVDIRVIAATNRDVGSLVRADGFRRDLYHRLNEFHIEVPPLRRRRADIILLANRFLELTNRELEKDIRGFSGAAIERLLDYPWPGNVRELRNVVRRGVLLADGWIEPDHLGISEAPLEADAAPPDINEIIAGSASFKEVVRRVVARVERQMLAEVLERTGGNKAEAARLLRIDYKTLHTKARDYGISWA